MTKSKVAGWEERFRPKLKKRHAHFAKKVFHRLMKKSSTLKSSLKKRSKEYEVEFEISLDQIRELFWKNYNTKCRYCKNKLDVANMVCDHFYPLSMGGGSTVKNLQIICGRCNTRKGSLTHKEYRKLLVWLDKCSDNMKSYVLRKLAKGDLF
tara:strand:+ start:324 stop:779 length:456 start_codon:yes stop_codon:yes gene_type:complete